MVGNITKHTIYKNPPPAHATKNSRHASTYEEHWAIITRGVPDHQLAILLGTKAGIDALAEFVKKSKAFQK